MEVLAKGTRVCIGKDLSHQGTILGDFIFRDTLHYVVLSNYTGSPMTYEHTYISIPDPPREKVWFGLTLQMKDESPTSITWEHPSGLSLTFRLDSSTPWTASVKIIGWGITTDPRRTEAEARKVLTERLGEFITPKMFGLLKD